MSGKNDFSGIYDLIPWTDEEKKEFLKGFLGSAYQEKKRKYVAPGSGQRITRTTIYIGYTPVPVVEDSVGNLYGVVIDGKVVDFNDFVKQLSEKTNITSMDMHDLIQMGQKLIPYDPDRAKMVAANAYPNLLPIASQFEQAFRMMSNGTNY